MTFYSGNFIDLMVQCVDLCGESFLGDAPLHFERRSEQSVFGRKGIAVQLDRSDLLESQQVPFLCDFSQRLHDRLAQQSVRVCGICGTRAGAQIVVSQMREAVRARPFEDGALRGNHDPH